LIHSSLPQFLEGIQELDLVVQDLGIAPVGLDKVHHMRQGLVDMAAVVADAGYAQCSHLPHVLVIDLSDGDVELILHPGGDRPEHHSLALKGMVFRDTQPDP